MKEEGDGHAVLSNTVKNVKEKECGDQEKETEQEDQEVEKEQGGEEEEKKEQGDQDKENEHEDQEDLQEQWDKEEEMEQCDKEEEKDQGDREVEKEQGDKKVENEQGDQEEQKEQEDQGEEKQHADKEDEQEQWDKEEEMKQRNQEEEKDQGDQKVEKEQEYQEVEKEQGVKRVSTSNSVSVLLENGEKMEQPVRDICSLPPGGGDPHWPGWPVSRVQEEEKRQYRQERRERELRKERRLKINYQVEEIHNMQDVVEESEYVDTVSKKRDEDWILVNDGGYVEDGGEIFDDEEGDGDFGGAEGGKAKVKTKEKGEKTKEGVKRSNVKNMLLAMPSRKTEDQGKLEDDKLQGDTVSNIAAKSQAPGVKKIKPVVSSAKVEEGAERSPFMKRGTGLKKTVKRQPVSQAVGEEGGQVEEQERQGEEEQVDTDGFEDDMDFNDTAQEKEQGQKEVQREDQEQDLELAVERPWLSHEASSIKIQVLS